MQTAGRPANPEMVELSFASLMYRRLFWRSALFGAGGLGAARLGAAALGAGTVLILSMLGLVLQLSVVARCCGAAGGGQNDIPFLA